VQPEKKILIVATNIMINVTNTFFDMPSLKMNLPPLQGFAEQIPNMEEFYENIARKKRGILQPNRLETVIYGQNFVAII